jgi:hypothetical protein
MSDRIMERDAGDPEINPQVVANSYAQYLSVAFAGMKGDSMDDNVDTFACATNPIGFGLVCSRTVAGALTIAQGGAIPIGVSLHDHTIASRGGYIQYDAVSVMNRGKVWCQVGTDTANIVDGAYVAYETATGKVLFTPTGNTVLPKAIFRSGVVAVYDITYTTTTNIALVELHYGLSV